MILLNIFTSATLMKPLTYQDFTIKARANSFERVKELLQQLGATRLGMDEQTDTYFKTDKGKLKLRVGTIENLITHYERFLQDGLERTVVYRYDLNPTQHQINELLHRGEQIGQVRKQRAIYLWKNHKIHLDKVGVEYFVEIETIDRQMLHTQKQLRDLCWELKEKLEICDEDLIPTGYFNPNS